MNDVNIPLKLADIDNPQERENLPPHMVQGIPHKRVRKNVQVGDLVQVILLCSKPLPSGGVGERIWVELKEIAPGRYKGIVVDKPEVLSALIQKGSEVELGPEHILTINTDERWE